MEQRFRSNPQSQTANKTAGRVIQRDALALIGLGGAASTQLKPSRGLAVMTSGSLAFKVLSELKADPVIRDFIGDSAAWEHGKGVRWEFELYSRQIPVHPEAADAIGRG